jgi:NAD(P)-dependent dehydrogenase (short-subunit alcohol dehydrogenase family)
VARAASDLRHPFVLEGGRARRAHRERRCKCRQSGGGPRHQRSRHPFGCWRRGSAAASCGSDQAGLRRPRCRILNAGILDFRPLEQWDEGGFDRSFAVNLKGSFFLIRALLPILANPSSIVLMTSINAHIGMPASSIYSATKAGMASIARTLSGELIGRGIRVNSVSPGPSRRRCMTARPKTSADSSWPRSRQAVWAVRARLRRRQSSSPRTNRRSLSAARSSLTAA